MPYFGRWCWWDQAWNFLLRRWDASPARTLSFSGKSWKHPIIERRISRCFFGPIKRFPKMRDDWWRCELLSGSIPEPFGAWGRYGLWLTVEFRDLIATSFTPNNGKDAEKATCKSFGERWRHACDMAFEHIYFALNHVHGMLTTLYWKNTQNWRR